MKIFGEKLFDWRVDALWVTVVTKATYPLVTVGVAPAAVLVVAHEKSSLSDLHPFDKFADALGLVNDRHHAVTARPDVVTPAALTNRVPAKKGREAREFWSPHVIGEHYKIRREPAPYQGGTHASPRFHWVEGSWKQQHYGPGRELRKTIWIEPYERGLYQEEVR
jgi:hypothetical protein